jgi:hypothetical protein
MMTKSNIHYWNFQYSSDLTLQGLKSIVEVMHCLKKSYFTNFEKENFENVAFIAISRI